MAYIGFVEEKGALYCELCYEKFFAPECVRCQKKILGVSIGNTFFFFFFCKAKWNFHSSVSDFYLLFSSCFTGLSVFMTVYYYKTKLNRPVWRDVRLKGKVVFGFVLLNVGLSTESLATVRKKIIYCGCAASPRARLLRTAEVAPDHTHQGPPS